MPPIPKRKSPRKPPYRVPSMTEISAIPWNGLNVCSLFAGCGGSSLGYRMAGFRVLWVNEFIEAARDCYRTNMSPGTIVDERDVRDVDPADVLERIKMKRGELDLLDGSPPCAAFSSAGKRQAGWGEVRSYSDTEQRTDDLFDQFVRLLRGIQPRTFVMENVSGFAKGVSKGEFIRVLRELRGSGYRASCKLLDAKFLGVPQSRQRTIFVGVREDLFDLDTGEEIVPVFPSVSSHSYTVRDVLPHIVRIQTGSYCSIWRNSEEVMGTIAQSDGSRGHRSQIETRGTGGILKRRKWTIDELKTICSFPKDFIITGDYEQQWERLGRAVPPLMMQAIAEKIKGLLIQSHGLKEIIRRQLKGSV